MAGLRGCTFDKHLCLFFYIRLKLWAQEGELYFLKVKSMQRSGTETIRTQLQPSKIKIPYCALIYKFVNLVVCTSCPEPINSFIYLRSLTLTCNPLVYLHPFNSLSGYLFISHPGHQSGTIFTNNIMYIQHVYLKKGFTNKTKRNKNAYLI